MTTKERDSEMLEVFKRKSALSKKITLNTKEVNKIDSEIVRVNLLLRSAKDVIELSRYRHKLRRMRITGNKLLSVQIKERRKLSFTVIGKQLNVKRAYLDKQYYKFLDDPRILKADEKRRI